MGAFNLGELFGVLRLESSPYLVALAEAEKATQDAKATLNSLTDNLEFLQRAMGGTQQSSSVMSAALTELQSRGLTLAESLTVLSAAVGNLSREQQAASVSELESYRSKVEAERIQYELTRARYVSEVEYATLTSRLRAEEAAGIREQIAATEVGLKQEFEYRQKTVRAAAAQELEYSNLVKQLRAQEAAATLAVRGPIEQSAAARRTEILNAEVLSAEKLFAEETAVFEANAEIRVNIEKGASTRRTEILAAELARAEALFAEQQVANAASGSSLQMPGIRGTLGSGGLSPHVGLGGGALAVGAGLFGGYELVKQAAEFQAALSKTKAVIGDVSTAMSNDMAKSAKDLAEQFGISASKIVVEFGTMSKAEVDFADQMKVLPAVTELAVATGNELDKTVKLILTVMNTLKIPFTEVSNVTNLFAAANRMAIGSVDDFAKAIEGRAGAAFRYLKVPLNEILSMVVAFARAGVESNVAQTALTQTITKLIASASAHGDVTLRVGDNMKRWHDIVYTSNGELKHLYEIFQTLDQALRDAPTDKAVEFFQAIGLSGQRDVYLRSLLGMGDALKTVADSLPNATERANQFKTASDNLLFSVKQAKEEFRNLAIELGTPFLGPLSLAAKAAAEASKEFRKLLDSARGGNKIDPILNFDVKSFPVEQTYKTVNDYVAALKKYSDAAHAFANYGYPVSEHEKQEAQALERAANNLIQSLGKKQAALEEDRKKTEKTEKDHFGSLGDLFEDPKKSLSSVLSSMSLGNAFQKFQDQYNAYARNLTKSQKDVLTSSLTELNEMAAAGADPKVLRDQLAKITLELNRFKVEDRQSAVTEHTNKRLQETFQELSAEYATSVNSFSSQQQEVISDALNRAFDSLKTGGSGQKLFDALSEIRNTLKRFNQEVRNEQLADNRQTAMDNAAQSVAAFREKFESDTRSLASEQSDVIRNLIAGLGTLVEDGIDPKRIEVSLRYAEGIYKLFTDGAKDSKVWVDRNKEAWKELQETLKNFSAGYKPPPQVEITGTTFSRLPEGFQRVLQIKEIMTQLGATSQEALNDVAQSTEKTVRTLVALQAPMFDLHAAMVKMWEAQAAAAHTSVEQVSADATKYYRKYKEETQNSVIAANKAWIESMRQVKGAIQQAWNDIMRSLAEVVIPSGAQASPLEPVISAFRDAYEKLSSYSDPKRALGDLVNSIKNAGDLATANAIAIKYFGTTAGPMLARDLRSGALSAKDISDAINVASKSTTDYADATKNSVSGITQVWRQLERELLVIIGKTIVEDLFKRMLGGIFDIQTKSKSLGQVLIDVWGKVKDAITGASKATSTAINIATLPTQNNSGLPSIWGTNPGTFGSTPPFNGGTIPGLGGGSGVPPVNPGNLGGSAGTFGMGSFGNVLGAAGAIGQVVSAVTGVIGVFQSMHQETSLNAIEHNTRYTEIIQEEFKRDSWDQHYGMLNKIDMWGHILENAIHGITGGSGGSNTSSYWMELLVSKFDLFVIPDLAQLVSNGFGPMAAAGGSGNVTITGPVTIQANDPETFLRRLKTRRIVRGVK